MRVCRKLLHLDGVDIDIYQYDDGRHDLEDLSSDHNPIPITIRIENACVLCYQQALINQSSKAYSLLESLFFLY